MLRSAVGPTGRGGRRPGSPAGSWWTHNPLSRRVHPSLHDEGEPRHADEGSAPGFDGVYRRCPQRCGDDAGTHADHGADQHARRDGQFKGAGQHARRGVVGSPTSPSADPLRWSRTERRMVGKGRAGGGVACGRGIGAVMALLRLGPGLRADPEQPACASMPCRLPRASRGRVRNQPPEAAQGRGDTVRQARRPIRSHRADRRDQ